MHHSRLKVPSSNSKGYNLILTRNIKGYKRKCYTLMAFSTQSAWDDAIELATIPLSENQAIMVNKLNTVLCFTCSSQIILLSIVPTNIFLKKRRSVSNSSLNFAVLSSSHSLNPNLITPQLCSKGWSLIRYLLKKLLIEIKQLIILIHSLYNLKTPGTYGAIFLSLNKRIWNV